VKSRKTTLAGQPGWESDHFLYLSFDQELPMKPFIARVVRFMKSEDGPTAVEYAVMLALIVVVCLTAIQAIGTNANITFDSVAKVMPSGS
jgi:pilus assembly protein Flp/PilA